MIPTAREIAVAIVGSPALSLIVKATVVAAAALVVARLARRRRASIRHLIPGTAFIVLLALPLAPAVAPERQVTMPILEPTPNAAAMTPATVLDVPPAVAPTADSGPAARRRQPRVTPSLSTVLLATWISGTALVLAPMLWGLVRIHRVRRNSVPWRDGELLVASVGSASGSRRSIQVLLDAAADGPMTCGVVQPAIVLPREARQWAMEDLRRAVVHEVEHVRRADWLTLCLARLVCAIYWFHPLVWMLWRQLRLEAERACDDAVLRSTDPETYADQLVTLAERLASNRTQSALAMADRNDLSARVSAVLDGRQSRGRAGSLWIAGAAVAAALLIVAIAPLRAVAVVGMAQPQASIPSTEPREAFELASVRPLATSGVGAAPGPSACRDGGWIGAIRIDAHRIVVPAVTPFSLVTLAYGQDCLLVDGAPEWIRAERFDIQGLFPPGTPNYTWRDLTESKAPTLQKMLQSLLAERFTLSVRRETKEMTVYTLIVAKDGKLKPSADQSVPTPPTYAGQGVARPAAGTPLARGAMQLAMTGLRVSYTANAVPLWELAKILQIQVGRSVVDKTNLRGLFDIHLEFSKQSSPPAPDAGPVVPPIADPQGPELATALQEQLGLKLVLAKIPMQVLMIEHIERPTEN
jgi:bla regulator protein blaR1